ncbi:hypothetical protein A1A1_03332 [Planococcus antarcticus DSM 14505]|uniref:Uncharacterized protein n=1 Tax=Planococcus antarcticus DSM 14505 TaxID=1185653 RepID=A0AA87IPG3_9BACL|nr:hypothetical protein [Planococcus antarcticus]EIM07852.1 hypothetical protein A1A1_03332 [Planococcus antarcticus DSM 14505]
MKVTKLYSFRNGMIYFSVVVSIMSVVLSSFPKSSAANDTLDEQEILNGTPHEIIELIKDIEGEVIYKALEDGKIYLYEEQIVGDVVTTKKSLVENGTSTLTEKFSTATILQGDIISVTQKDLLANKIIHQEMVSITDETAPSKPHDDIHLWKPPVYPASVGTNNEFTAMATGTWLKARTAGQNYAYYKNSNGGGLARELGKQKTIGSYTTKFDTFTRNVDAVRSYEVGALYNFTAIGLLDKAFKSIKYPTISNLKKFFKQYLKTIPGVGTLYLVIKYFSLCNKTLAAYKAIPGTPYNWR